MDATHSTALENGTKVSTIGLRPLGFLTGSASVIGIPGQSVDLTFYPSTELMAGVWTVQGTAYTFQSYFCTTQALAPTEANVQEAYLMLNSNPTPINGDGVHANSGTNNAFYVRRVVGDWDVTQMDKIKWTSRPATTTDDQVLIPHTTLASDDLAVNVTAMVKTAIRQGETMIGFCLVPVATQPLNMRNFVSPYHERLDRAPRLVIITK
ncbi:hypothetical protein F0L74_29705 [Chitinophaga agrisoli]|uniref:Uncharacterized protein n=1 Tax=Chitinophaga agrisoli TaxID=2607653 RepID=A0A5B2VMV1_9BACT|nr:hypothetical protein [Chitinophaga agrisoli]KAA2240335.1 hypothetical protein F0L74_29705 [Chitinophaga agrisoli]